ncbi:MAG: site-2 protease family protein [bacterium]
MDQRQASGEEERDDGIQGAAPIMRVAGITVYLHWSWLLVALILVQNSFGHYSSLLFRVLEYLSIFGLVLLHEFGHSLACRSVGGKADRIMLWPLGGVAFVQPPQRPGATLWSIAAGPLVNVVMVLLLYVSGLWLRDFGVWETNPNLHELGVSVFVINIGMLMFNLWPIYPLDGGQILRSLLWFVFGRANSLLIAVIIGFLGVGLLVALAAMKFLVNGFVGGVSTMWLVIIAVFMLMSCWRGLLSALALARLERIPRHKGAACPGCGEAPMIGRYWDCNRCHTRFDTFETNAACPGCGTVFLTTLCQQCGESSPMAAWKKTAHEKKKW